MDFTQAPSDRKRRQVNDADNRAAMDRVRDTLVGLGISRNDMVTKIFMQGEWKKKRSCEFSAAQEVTQTQWDKLPAKKRIDRKLLLILLSLPKFDLLCVIN